VGFSFFDPSFSGYSSDFITVHVTDCKTCYDQWYKLQGPASTLRILEDLKCACWPSEFRLCLWRSPVTSTTLEYWQDRWVLESLVPDLWLFLLFLVWFILRPCQHDNGYIDGRSQIKVHTDERTRFTALCIIIIYTRPTAIFSSISLLTFTVMHCSNIYRWQIFKQML